MVDGDNIIELSTGVKLKVRPINPMVLDAALRQNMPPVPKVPRVFIENKGREEENPDDPAYRAAVDEYEAERGRIVQDVAMGLGTEVITVPDGMESVDGTRWAEDLWDVGVLVPDSGLKRYIAWVKFWACRTAQDTVDVISAVMQSVGTPEAKVAEAADSFRNRKERRADSKRAN